VDRDFTKMPDIEVLAPGKVILHGEHAVVYGKKAVAVSINLCSSLIIKDGLESLVELQFPDIGLDVKIGLDDLDNLRKQIFGKESQEDYVSNLSKGIQLLRDNMETLASFAQGKVPEDPSDAIKYANQVRVTQCFASLCVLLFETQPALVLTATSELPLGAGLGSSASFSVALSCGLLHRAGRVEKELSESDLKDIYDLSFFCETIFHGSPSGIDNFIATYGGAVVFQRKEGSQNIEEMAKRIKSPDIRVVLVDSKVPRSTQAMVQKAKDLKDSNPDAWNEIMNGIGELTETAISEITEDHGVRSELLRKNQALLKSLGMSHEKLDQILKIADDLGFSGKLTGAGGGGCVFIHVPEKVNDLEISKLKEKLHELDFGIWDTALGGVGVRIL